MSQIPFLHGLWFKNLKRNIDLYSMIKLRKVNLLKLKKYSKDLHNQYHT